MRFYRRGINSPFFRQWLIRVQFPSLPLTTNLEVFIMSYINYSQFPAFDKESRKNRVYHIYPKKGIVVIDGFKRFRLKDLKKISLNTRLSFPPDLFAAISES
jgi:hypothetical protein